MPRFHSYAGAGGGRFGRFPHAPGRSAGNFREAPMNCPWRAIMLAAVLTLGAFGAPMPALAQANAPADGNDPFGEAVTLTPKTIVYLKGNSTWDKALDNLQDAFKSVYALLDKQGIKRAGPAMTVYNQADDTGFQFQAAVPV